MPRWRSSSRRRRSTRASRSRFSSPATRCNSFATACSTGLAGLGTGTLRDHYDAIAKGGGRFYLSGMSSSARAVTAEDLKGKPAEFAQPNVLIRLSLDHDRMFTY